MRTLEFKTQVELSTWTTYVAMNADGRWFEHEEKPRESITYWVNDDPRTRQKYLFTQEKNDLSWKEECWEVK